ncbi:MAG: hypothetical protein KDK48_01170 [Chlamydiia bacterium]|nr:hypothetical protein [Chlamydiia bacterium]
MNYLFSTICSLAILSLFTVGGKAKQESITNRVDGHAIVKEQAAFVGAFEATAGASSKGAALNVVHKETASPDVILSDGQRYRIHPFQQHLIQEWKEGEIIALSTSSDSHPITLKHLSSGTEIRAKKIF